MRQSCLHDHQEWEKLPSWACWPLQKRYILPCTPSHLGSKEKQGREHGWYNLIKGKVISEWLKNCLNTPHAFNRGSENLIQNRKWAHCSAHAVLWGHGQCPSQATWAATQSKRQYMAITIVTKSKVESEGFKARNEILTCTNMSFLWKQI